MSKVRRIDWSPSEWLAGTRGIGMDETAVYITVLNIIYDRGDACPNDAAFIADQMARSGMRHSQARSAANVRTAAALVRLIEMGKLKVSPDSGRLTNGRANIELGKAGERIIGAARAGYASGRARRASAHPAPTQVPPQRHPSAYPASADLSNSNDLDRTAVRIINHQLSKSHESVTTTSTDAARDPALDGGSGPRASRPETTQERLLRLAMDSRQRFMRKGSA